MNSLKFLTLIYWSIMVYCAVTYFSTDSMLTQVFAFVAGAGVYAARQYIESQCTGDWTH